MATTKPQHPAPPDDAAFVAMIADDMFDRS